MHRFCCAGFDPDLPPLKFHPFKRWRKWEVCFVFCTRDQQCGLDSISRQSKCMPGRCYSATHESQKINTWINIRGKCIGTLPHREATRNVLSPPDNIAWLYQGANLTLSYEEFVYGFIRECCVFLCVRLRLIDTLLSTATTNQSHTSANQSRTCLPVRWVPHASVSNISEPVIYTPSVCRMHLCQPPRQ